MVEQSTANPFFYVRRVLLQMQSAAVFPKGLPIAIDDIAKAVVAIGSIDEIQIKFVDVASRSALGIFTRKIMPDVGEVAEIIVSSRLDESLKRFVVCKEICQVFLSDATQTRSADANEISAYVMGLLDQSIYKPFSPALLTDQFATVCALELLCPFFIRERFYMEFEERKRTIEDLAQLFCIPLEIAAVVFSSSYHDNSLRALDADRRSDFRLDPRSQSLSADLQLMFQRNVETALSENKRIKP